MKRLLIILLTLGAALYVVGQQPSVTSGRYFLLQSPEVKGVDYVYVFEDLDQAQFESVDQQLANWYEFPSRRLLAHRYTLFSNLEDGKTYRVGNVSFAVVDYKRYRLNETTLAATPSCDNVLLSLNINPMQYVDTMGVTRTIERRGLLRCYNQIWSTDGWTNSEQTDSVDLTNPNQIIFPRKLLISSDFILTGDRFAEFFYDAPDSVRSAECHAIAVAHHAQTLTAKRGDKYENEIERPIEETTIKGSAPLNILFKANGSAMSEYYEWQFYRYENLLTTRADNEQRYIFDEVGSYKVKLTITTSDSSRCSCDTTFDNITVKESMIWVPNVFTPNGDGKNDEFRVAYRSLAKFQCWLYNRWGHQVYSWTDPAKGWNGRINGRLVPDGAYYYVIDATGTDGEHYKLKGAVNLLSGK